MSGSTRLLPSLGVACMLPPSRLKFSAIRSSASSDDGCRAVIGDRGTQLDCGKGVGTSGMGKETGDHQEICEDHAGVPLTKQKLFSPGKQPPPCQGGECGKAGC